MNLFNKLFGTKKGTAQYHLKLGIDALNMGIGNYENAVVEFSKAIELDDHLVDAYFNRGLGYHFLGKFELAIDDFDKTLELAPQNYNAKYWRLSAFSGQQHEKLENLFSLPNDKEEVSSEKDVSQIVQKTIDALVGVKKYRSQLIVKDLKCTELKDYQYKIIGWSFDFISPDSFNINQFTHLENYPIGAGDIWISLGTHNFITIHTATVKSERRLHSTQIEKFINMDKYLEYLKTVDLQSISLKQIDNGGIYVIETELPKNIMLGDWPISQFRQQLARNLYHVFGKVEGDTIEFFEVPIISDLVAPHSIGVDPDLAIVLDNLKLVLKLWINASDYYPVKAEVDIDGYLENGEKISFVIEQVFSDFNNNVQIITPPL